MQTDIERLIANSDVLFNFVLAINFTRQQSEGQLNPLPPNSKTLKCDLDFEYV